jgi:hypothetical protein
MYGLVVLFLLGQLCEIPKLQLVLRSKLLLLYHWGDADQNAGTNGRGLAAARGW